MAIVFANYMVVIPLVPRLWKADSVALRHDWYTGKKLPGIERIAVSQVPDWLCSNGPVTRCG